MAATDTYKEVRVMEFPNMTVNVLIPDITPHERERRMKQIEKAAASLLMSERKQPNAAEEKTA